MNAKMRLSRLQTLLIRSPSACFNHFVWRTDRPSMGAGVRSQATAMLDKEVPWRRVLQEVTAALRGSGLDLLAPLSVEWYNAAVPPDLHLPSLGRDRAPLAILVGNSKAVWEPFISTLRKQPCMLDSPHPFNTFVKQSLTSSLSVSFDVIDTQLLHGVVSLPAANSKPVSAVVYWDYDTRPGRLVAMQRLAQLTGIATWDESTNLCVHPIYGPWFALRALVLFNVDPPSDRERPQLPQSHSRAAACEQVQKARKKAIEEDQSTTLYSVVSEPVQQWRHWLAARDSIQPNHPMRYESDQIEYHYTHNKDILTRLAAPVARSRR